MFEYRWGTGTIVSAISAFSLAVSQSLFERKMAIPTYDQVGRYLYFVIEYKQVSFVYKYI